MCSRRLGAAVWCHSRGNVHVFLSTRPGRMSVVVTEGFPNSTPTEQALLDTVAETPVRNGRDLSRAGMVTFQVLYGTVGVLVICGNTLTIAAIVKFPRLHKVTSNIFIVSLSAADLVIVPCVLLEVVKYSCSLNLQARKAYIVLQKWPAFVSSQAALMTLLCIAVDRVIAVSRPLTYRQLVTKARAKVAVATVWVYTLTLTGFGVCYYGVTADTRLLLGDAPFVMWMPAALITFLMYQTYAFVSLTCLLYVVVYVKIVQQKTKIGSVGVPEDGPQRRKLYKTTRMMLILVLALLLSWIPLTVYSRVATPTSSNFFYIFMSLHVLLSANHLVNPAIYCGLNADFRKAFLIMLRLKSKEEADLGTGTFTQASMNNGSK